VRAPPLDPPRANRHDPTDQVEGNDRIRSVPISRAMVTALSMNRASPSLATLLASATRLRDVRRRKLCEMPTNGTDKRRRKTSDRDESANRTRADAHRGEFLLVNRADVFRSLSHTRWLTVAVAEIAVATPAVDTARATSRETPPANAAARDHQVVLRGLGSS